MERSGGCGGGPKWSILSRKKKEEKKK